MLRPETRLVSVTYPHNPTGAMIDRDTLERLVAIVERHGTARLLVDETYRELAYADPLPVAAVALAAGAERLVDVEDLRAPRPADRLDRLPRSASSPRPCSRPRSRS